MAGVANSKPKRGTLWAELWTRTMDRCAGYDTPAPKPEDDDVDDWDEEPEDPATNAKREQKGHSPLPCMPMTALYAHTAAFGLDVRRWSVGLDSGCVRHLLSPFVGCQSPEKLLIKCGMAGVW